MKKSTYWMIFALALAAVAGTSVGVVADRTFLAGEEPEKKRREGAGELWFDCDTEVRPDPHGSSSGGRSGWLERMGVELGLDAEQEEALRAAFSEHGAAADEFWQRTRDEYCDLRAALRSEVRGVLTDEQLATMRSRMKRKQQSSAAADEQGR